MEQLDENLQSNLEEMSKKFEQLVLKKDFKTDCFYDLTFGIEDAFKKSLRMQVSILGRY